MIPRRLGSALDVAECALRRLADDLDVRRPAGREGVVSAADVLRRARARIEHPGAWIQGDLARDEDGDVVDPASPRAVCFCAIGALMREIGPRWSMEAGSAEDFLIKAAHAGSSIASINDLGTHADVMRLYDVAIASAEASC